jgi:hypothetical protein
MGVAMLKKIVFLSSLLVTSMTAQAALIQYGDYKRDSASNIVTGHGLEWLKWDVTKDMSINSALALYEIDGWRLASNDEMASLFRNFNFIQPSTVFGGGVNTWTAAWDTTEDSLHNMFVKLFGNTVRHSCSTAASTGCYAIDDPYLGSLAYFGSPSPSGRYRLAEILDDSTFIRQDGMVFPRPHLAQTRHHSTLPTGKDITVGVALVRDHAPVSVSAPASIGLFVLGLVALGFRRRSAFVRKV